MLKTFRCLRASCAKGKDRAGMLAALVLLALGVDEELVCWDYEQTELALRRKRSKRRFIGAAGH